MNEQETKVCKNTIGWLLRLLTACPQVIKKGVGAEEFAKELISACLELETYSSDFFGTMDLLLSFVSICPQIFNPEIGIKTFLNELNKAALIFNKSIK